MPIQSQNTRKKGFTLTELLVTTVTIGILAGMLMPAINKARYRAKDASCLTQQRNLYIALEDTFNEAIPDFTIRQESLEQGNELSRIFVQHYLHPMEKDSEFGELSVYTSRPLTCPYSSSRGKGKTRAPFIPVFMNEFHAEWRTSKFASVKYFTYNYKFDVEHLRLDREKDINQGIAVMDLPNYGFREKTSVGDWFSGIADDKLTENYASQSLSFDSSLLHPNKGRGRYATFGNGSQCWVSEEESSVATTEPVESEK